MLSCSFGPALTPVPNKRQALPLYIYIYTITLLHMFSLDHSHLLVPQWEAQEAELRDQALGSGEPFDPTATLVCEMDR